MEGGLGWDGVEGGNVEGMGIGEWSLGRGLEVLNGMKCGEGRGYGRLKR